MSNNLPEILSAIHLLANRPDTEFPDEKTIETARIFYLIIFETIEHPDIFAHMISTYQKNFPGSDLHDSTLRAIKYLDGNWLYTASLSMANMYIKKGDHNRALSYSPYLLTETRSTQDSCEAVINDTKSYDQEIHQKPAQQLCQFALDSLKKWMPSPRLRVLDIGCGSGLNSDYLIRHTDWLCGMDLSAAPLQQAGRAKRYDHFVEGDAEKTISNIEDFFNLIICTGTIYFFRKLDWLFEHAKRLLTQDGVFVFNTVMADNSADIKITRGGNFRYCHSIDYLNKQATRHGLQLDQPIWTINYGLPYWHCRLTHASH